MIKLRFDKLYSKNRVAEPCHVSIPFPKGKLFREDGVKLFQEERCLPVQKKVLARYPDGSVKYLFLRFLADIPANKGAEVLCDLNSERQAETSALRCVCTDNGYKVDTGKIQFVVADESKSLFERAEAFGKVYSGAQFVGPILKKAGERAGEAVCFGKWNAEEQGDVCVILSNEGNIAGIRCQVRVTAYAGKACADVELRLINDTEELFEMASYEFKLQDDAGEAAKVRTCVADSNYKTSFLVSEEGEYVEKTITAEFLLNQGNEHFAETYYGTFFADRTDATGGVCATVYQAHQNFPKAVCADRKGICVRLIPDGSTPAPLQSGMAIKQQFRLYFHEKDEDLQDINHESIMYQMPDYPILDSSVYEESGLFPDIFVKKGLRDDMVEAGLIAAADLHTRSYGMMNWGDAPDANYTAQGRGQGKLVWTNNEYDFPHACMLQFARTGIRRFLDYCLVAGTHQRDVDVCHYSKNELLAGGQWEHTKGHCLDGEIVCSHEWVEGLLDCYHITGDARFLETAVGIGENVLRLLNTPVYRKAGGLNARETGWALRTLTALYKETYDEKWTKECEWIVGQFKEWSDSYGGWLAPYTDNTMIRVPFMISVAVGSLMRYYREFPRDDIREMILNAVDDMIEYCYMENGYFIYKELPSLSRVGLNPLVLEALAIAYELTGESSYLTYGQKTFQASVKGDVSGYNSGKRIAEDAVLVGNTGTKRFAQMFVPVATYYKAMAECGLKK